MKPSAGTTTSIADADADADAGAATRPTLAGLLRAHAAGGLTEACAVDLLIAHRHWLTHPGFTSRFVHPITTTTTGDDDGRQIGAWIDWPAAATALQHGQLPCSASEADMLRIAASLADDLPIILHDVLGGLDRANIAAVTAAITAVNPT